MLRLLDVIGMSGVELRDFKIHCATGRDPGPLEEFYDGNFKNWQEHQTKENFRCKEIISLIHLGGARWLFAGVFRVLGVRRGIWRGQPCFEYRTEEIEEIEDLTGRAIVHFNRTFRASYLRDKKFADQLEVVCIRERRMSIGEFPGFNQVLLSHSMLKTIVRQQDRSWKAALGNVGGVYLLTDTSTGLHYVGSAYGGAGLWQRWESYAKTGHGGNSELRQLLRKQGNEHAIHFQYSLLEICDLNSSSENVIERECHWKDVLKSREFGLNSN